MEEETIILKKQLEKHVKEEDAKHAIEALQRMEKIEMNVKILEKTGVGVAVGKLRKHSDQELANQAAKLVDKWKKLVPTTQHKEKDSKDKKKDKKKEKKETKKEEKKEEKVEPKKEEKSKETNGQVKKEEIKQPTPPVNKRNSLTSSNGSNSSDDPHERVAKLFREALEAHFKEGQEYGNPDQLARLVEKELWNKYGGMTKDYTHHSRRLFLNLKNKENPELAGNVLSGIITPARLIDLTPDELASDKMLELKKQMEKDAFKNALAASGMPEDTTDAFKCGRCKQRKCTYYEMQTRSADEPMTAFITCTVCRNRWKQ